jgi:hypothetical protein
MSTETINGPTEAPKPTEADVRTSGHPSVTELLTRVMADVNHVGKDGYNKQQSYNFRGIDAVLNAVGPAFRAHGIVPKPILKKVTYENILVGEKRTPMTRCTVEVKYRFKGPGGDFEDVTVPGEAFDSGDKGTAKAMSVAYRIALIQLLALPTTEPDPDESSYERSPAAVTDQRWLSAVRQRIAAATDRDALNVIGADIGAQADAGQLAPADGDRLRAEFDARWSALATPAPLSGPAGNEWETPARAVAEQQDRDAEASQELPPPSPMVPRATPDQLEEIGRLLEIKRGAVNGDRRAIVSQLVRRQVDDPRGLSQAEARSIIETLSAEPDHVQLPTTPAPAPEPTGPPVAGATAAQMRMMHALLRKGGHTKDGGHVLMTRVTGRQITSANDLTTEEAGAVITALTTGEIPTPSGPAPAGPNATGEGISEFDVLDQMILDVNSDEAAAETEKAIADELLRKSITRSDAERLLERLAEHVKRAKAGASA